MTADTPLPDPLRALDAYWRAANYLSVGQIYLLDNPLLREPLRAGAHQAAAARTLGHDAGPELHLRAPESGHHGSYDLDMIYISGPGPRRAGAWSPTPIWKAPTARSIRTITPGRSRAADAVPAVLVSRRHSEPRRAGNARQHPRRRRARLLAEPCVRRGVRQPRSDRRLRRSATAKPRPARWPRPGTRTSSSIRPPTARCCRSCI